MPDSQEQARVVLCEDDPVLRDWVLREARSIGIEVVCTTSSWPESLGAVVDRDAHAFIVDLATVGRVGLRLLRAVRELVPTCQVMVITPLHAVDLSALDAGAAVVVGPDDLRELAAAMRRLQAEVPHPTA